MRDGIGGALRGFAELMPVELGIEEGADTLRDIRTVIPRPALGGGRPVGWGDAAAFMPTGAYKVGKGADPGLADSKRHLATALRHAAQIG